MYYGKGPYGPPPSQKKEYFVEYKVYGGYDYTYDVDYANPQGGHNNVTGCVGNWNYTFTTHEPNFDANVRAYLNECGTIRAEIWVNGKKIKSSESHGESLTSSASCYVSEEPEKGFLTSHNIQYEKTEVDD